MAAEESVRFVRYSGFELTSIVVEQLYANVRRLATEFQYRPAYAIFRPSAELRREVFTIIDRRRAQSTVGVDQLGGEACTSAQAVLAGAVGVCAGWIAG